MASRQVNTRNSGGGGDSPILQTAKSSGMPSLDDSELYTVDKKKETVHGLVNEYSDSSNPILRREAQKGIEMAASRGLTNSSIASGNAIGKVLDKTTEWATADAAHYNNRKTENVKAATNKYGTDKGFEANKYATDAQSASNKYSTDANSASNKYSSDAQSASNKYSSDNTLAGNKYNADKTAASNKYSTDAQSVSSKYSSDKQHSASVASSNATITAAGLSAGATKYAAGRSSNATVTAAGLSANATTTAAATRAAADERIQAQRNQLEASRLQADINSKNLDRASQEKISTMNKDANMFNSHHGNIKTALTSNMNNFQAGVAAIDQSASPATQQEQFNRLDAIYTSNQTAIESW